MGGLNQFYRRLTSPSASAVALIYTKYKRAIRKIMSKNILTSIKTPHRKYCITEQIDIQ